MKTVLLLGLFDTAISVANCLKDFNTRIIGCDYNPQLNGFYSRRIKGYLSPNPQENPKEWLEFVKNIIDSNACKPVIIPTSDEYLELIGRYNNELNRLALYLIPNYIKINEILNREKQFQMAINSGFNIPSFVVNKNDLLDSLNKALRFPLVVKPQNIIDWKKFFSEKGFIFYELRSLLEFIEKLESINLKYIVQNFLEGETKNNFEINSLFLKDHGIVFQHSFQKIRQFPDKYGTATCIISRKIPELEEKVRKFIISNQLFGFTNIELKYNPSDKRFYYIETNPRVWLQINFSRSCGINFPKIYIDYLTSGRIPNGTVKIKENVKWVDVKSDLLYWYRNRKTSNTNLINHIRSWIPLVSLSLFSFLDPIPFLRDLKFIKQIKRIFHIS